MANRRHVTGKMGIGRDGEAGMVDLTEGTIWRPPRSTSPANHAPQVRFSLIDSAVLEKRYTYGTPTMFARFRKITLNY